MRTANAIEIRHGITCATCTLAATCRDSRELPPEKHREHTCEKHMNDAVGQYGKKRGR